MSDADISIRLPMDHPHLDEILRLARQGGEQNTDGVSRAAALAQLLEARLNGGERAILSELASRAPDVVSFERLVEVAGSGRKLGNIASGLIRRWTARGGLESEAPWQAVPGQGRRMDEQSASQVLSRLERRGQGWKRMTRD